MRDGIATRLIVGAGLAGLLVLTTRCAGPDATSTTKTSSAAAPRAPSGALDPSLARAAVQNGLLPHGRPSVAWMAEIHTAGMQDFMAHRAALRAGSHADRCRGIEQMIRRQLPQITAATGIRNDEFYQRAIAAAMTRIDCAGASPLSLWEAPMALAASQEETVTGAYEQYAGALENAMLASSDPQDAANQMDAVLGSATDLGAADATVLAGIAALGASSASYWYSVEQSGSGSAGTTIQPMSIVRTMFCGYWCHVGWGDLVGAVGGAASVVYTTGGIAAAVPEAVLGGALVGGLAGSAANAF